MYEETQAKSNNFLKIIIIALVLFLAFGGGFLLKGSSVLESMQIGQSADKQEDKQTAPKIEDSPNTEVIKSEREIVVLGNKEVTLPLGWRITKFAYYSQPLQQDLKEMLFSKEEDFVSGYYPIFQGSTIEISNQSSKITIALQSELIPGGFGFGPSELGEEWEVIQEPENDEVGFARKKLGNTYEYTNIYKCAYEEMCGKYEQEVGIGSFKFIFEGDEGEISKVEEFYREYILNKENRNAIWGAEIEKMKTSN
jgi:hypothetical protein